VTRDKLIRELAELTSPEALTTWAARRMVAKNVLTVDDARAVEAAFAARRDGFTGSDADPAAAPFAVAAQREPASGATMAIDRGLGVNASNSTLRAVERSEDPDSPNNRPGGIDKSVLAISEPRRYRNKQHLKFVAAQACLVCGRQPSDPHHLGFAQPRALGRKVSDEFAVPLCRVHHREVHRAGNEAEWWKTYSLTPLTVASALWAQSRPVGPSTQAASLDRATETGKTAQPSGAAPRSQGPSKSQKEAI
jgi:hypothetical protein